MIKATKGHVELNGSCADLMTELIFAVDAVVRTHAENCDLTLEQAKVIVMLQLGNAFENYIVNDEINEHVEMTTIKIPKRKKDGDE